MNNEEKKTPEELFGDKPTVVFYKMTITPISYWFIKKVLGIVIWWINMNGQERLGVFWDSCTFKNLRINPNSNNHLDRYLVRQMMIPGKNRSSEEND